MGHSEMRRSRDGRWLGRSPANVPDLRRRHEDDILPSATTLVKWWWWQGGGGSMIIENACPLCSKRQTLEQIPSACKVGLRQGRYTWRHKKGARGAGSCCGCHKVASKQSGQTKPEPKRFLKAG